MIEQDTLENQAKRAYLSIGTNLGNRNLNIEKASEILGLSKRQFSRFLSGETYAKRVHSLAMQMVWLISENKREFDNKLVKKKAKKISIPIK